MEPSDRGTNPSRPHRFRTFVKLTVGGGVAFWAGTIALSVLPIAAEYRAALSLDYFQTVFVEALVAGTIVGGCVSFVLLRFFEKLPTKNAILKSEILSFIAFAILSALVQIASSRVPGSDSVRVFLIGVVLNVPRFALLGLMVGGLYNRLVVTGGRTSTSSVAPG